MRDMAARAIVYVEECRLGSLLALSKNQRGIFLAVF